MAPDAPVVLLHAFPLNASMWAPQISALAGRQVLAPDFPGFGSRAVGPPDLDDFARVALEEMDIAGIPRAVVVGLSMGGYVALRVHALAPDRVAGMVLADTRAGTDDKEGRAKRVEQAVRARQEGTGWLQDSLLSALLGETTQRDRALVVKRVRDMLGEADPEGVARALEAMGSRPDSVPRLAEIQVPVLALVGEEDTLTPKEESQRISNGVRNGRLIVIPKAGHLSNLEAPGLFNDALLEFLG